jgi:3',5'-cyclic AMP phosphodiesterase CpdA
VLVSGDLADDGAAATYRRVLELLEPLAIPLFVLAGNHDDRATMRREYGLPGSGADPIRYAAAVGELRLVACDTVVPGSDGGSLDAEHRDWLAAELALEPDWPTVVAMHHPPILTGLDTLDEIGLPEPDRAGLAELLAANPQVVRVLCGHVHRATFGTLGGCGVVICPSTHAQAKLEIGMTEFALSDEPPGFALHAWVGDQLASHIGPVSG